MVSCLRALHPALDPKDFLLCLFGFFKNYFPYRFSIDLFVVVIVVVLAERHGMRGPMRGVLTTGPPGKSHSPVFFLHVNL